MQLNERLAAADAQMSRGTFIQLTRAAMDALTYGKGETFIVASPYGQTVVHNEAGARALAAALPDALDCDVVVVVQLVQLSVRNAAEPAPQCDDEEGRARDLGADDAENGMSP